jgi:hypothetical protein
MSMKVIYEFKAAIRQPDLLTAKAIIAEMENVELERVAMQDRAWWSDEVPYVHGMILEPGPNTSELPREGNAIVGAFWGLVFIGAIAAFVAAGWYLGVWVRGL